MGRVCLPCVVDRHEQVIPNQTVRARRSNLRSVIDRPGGSCGPSQAGSGKTGKAGFHEGYDLEIEGVDAKAIAKPTLTPVPLVCGSVTVAEDSADRGSGLPWNIVSVSSNYVGAITGSRTISIRGSLD